MTAQATAKNASCFAASSHFVFVSVGATFHRPHTSLLLDWMYNATDLFITCIGVKRVLFIITKNERLDEVD